MNACVNETIRFIHTSLRAQKTDVEFAGGAVCLSADFNQVTAEILEKFD